MLKKITLIGIGVAAFVLVGTATPAGAMHAVVRCSPGTTGDGEYGSISAALEAARAESARDHVIEIYGNCAESVTIELMDNVQIIGYEGATLRYPASTPIDRLVKIADSRAIRISNLTIAGRADVDFYLITIFDSIGIRFTKVRIQESGGTGLLIHNGSTVEFSGCAIERHARTGVVVEGNSVANFGATTAPGPDTHVVIQDNGLNGVVASDSALIYMGGDVSVLNNRVDGVRLNGAAMRACCQEGGERRIAGNHGTGIQAFGGYIDTAGPLTIENNEGSGAVLWGAHLVTRNVGPLIIRNNAGSGLIAASNSVVQVSYAQVEANQRHGIRVQDGSTGEIINSSVRTNGAEGVFAFGLSVAAIYGGNTIAGNGGFDLFCAPDSLGRGTKAGIDKMMCPAFSQSPTPNPGPPW